MRGKSQPRFRGSNRAQRPRRAKQIGSTPSQECSARGSGLTLLDLPQDIFNVVVDIIGVGDTADRDSARDMASIARTCKKLRTYIEPHLYQKIYTRIGTTHETGSIVRLLRQRPDIGSIIRIMILDDFDHRQTRHLMSHEFPCLRRLLIQHEGDVPDPISAREKRLLNRKLRPQPILNERMETRWRLHESLLMVL